MLRIMTNYILLLGWFMTVPILQGNLAGQNWGGSSTWYYTKQYAFQPGLEEVTMIRAIKDSMIGGQVAYEFEIINNLACTNVHQYIFMFSTPDEKVYIKINDEADFQMLYDFNADIGESWTFPIQTMDSLRYFVTAVSSINVNGEERKMLECVITLTSGVYEYVGPTPTYLIEGIGDVFFMFPWQYLACDEDFIVGLRCYEDSVIGTYYHGTHKTCDIMTSVRNLQSNQQIMVYPNPTSQDIYVNSSSGENLKYQIVDLTGQAIRNGVIEKSRIDLERLTKGIYILQISNDNGLVGYSKIVKN
jgi:hypothetical protein